MQNPVCLGISQVRSDLLDPGIIKEQVLGIKDTKSKCRSISIVYSIYFQRNDLRVHYVFHIHTVYNVRKSHDSRDCHINIGFIICCHYPYSFRYSAHCSNIGNLGIHNSGEA